MDKISKILKKNKVILTVFIMASFLVLIDLILMAFFIKTNPESVSNFLQKQELNPDILPFTIMSILAFVLFTILFVIIFIFFIRLFFPNSKSFSNLFLMDDIKFLLNLPREMGEEINKDGE